MIKVDNITKVYTSRNTLDNLMFLFGFKRNSKKQTKAVDNISFQINPGEIVGIIGPNGAGKTTTIKMLTGLLRPTEGTIKIGKYTPFELSRDFKLAIGLFRGEVSSLDDGVIIKDSIEERLRIYGKKNLKSNQYAKRLFEIAETDRFLGGVPEELSQGQRTLIEFVASIVHKPKYLFLDEPTNGLDINAVTRFKEVIRYLNSELGITILITSHNLQHVVELSHRIILINKGKILIDKETDAVMHKDTLDRVIKFYIESKEGTANMPNNMNLNYPWVTVKVNKSNLEDEILKGLKRFKVSDIRITEPPVEEIFAGYYK
ncbi:MAG: ATP-binding cassette domain-containing protein [Candidatus Dojkabacteria bacterium]|nr:ATP-binding cassette domain-containing protein [Candidatus Dojkabacteria bacterium]